MTRNKIEFCYPRAWKPLIDEAAGDAGMSALIRAALCREVKRLTGKDLPGELARPGRPRKDAVP